MAVRQIVGRTLVVLGLLAAIAFAWNASFFNPGAVSEYIAGFGARAPIIWVLLYLVAVFIPYATSVMTIAAGLAFGVVWGSILVYLTTIFASLLPMLLSRRLGRSWVEAKVGNTYVGKYVKLINGHAFLVFLYLRLIPSIPDELKSHIAGISRITPIQFFLASVLGNGPLLLVMVFLGAGLAQPGSLHFWISVVLYFTAIVVPVAIIVLWGGRLRCLFVGGGAAG